MISLILHHTGELFLQTPEQEHPLNLKLELISGKDADPFVLTALSHELEHAVLWFFDLRFSELVDFEYSPDDSKFALNLIRMEVLNNIISMIDNDITSKLADKNIVGFEITSLT